MIHPEFYWYPLLTCVSNLFFGAISIYLLVDVKSHQRKLGSLQEFSYYYTSERSFIMIIGSLVGLFCSISSAYCLNHIAQFLVDVLDLGCEGWQWDVKLVFYYGVLAILSVIYYHVCKIQDYQSYIRLGYFILIGLFYSILSCVILCFWAICFGDWQNDEMLIKINKDDKDEIK